jgi:hypothetical protein
MHVGQAEGAAAVAIGELLIVDPHEVEDRGVEVGDGAAVAVRVPKPYLRSGGLRAQTAPGRHYRAREAVKVDAEGRPWLNPRAQPHVAVSLGAGAGSVPEGPVVPIELRGDGRRVLILSEGWLAEGGGDSGEYDKWTIGTRSPPDGSRLMRCARLAEGTPRWAKRP